MPQINTQFAEELKNYGAGNFELCYNCGNCTATCELSSANASFPREMIRYSTLGLEHEIKSSLKPWLCYYCGECSTDCPRQANPGELMMSLRRWLTARYDWTGLSALLYKNPATYLIGFLIIILSVLFFANYHHFNHQLLLHYGHYFEIGAIAGVFAFILLPDTIRMWYFTVVKTKTNASLKIYLKTFSELLVHMFTQKQIRLCDNTNENKIRWFEHFILVIGYLTLLFTTVFLNWFESDNIGVIVFGYLVSSVVFVVTFDFVLSRIRKKSPLHQFSHPSDWYFVVWLFLMGTSALTVRLLIDTTGIDKYFWVYLFHLIILVQWALIIVPFGKWTHFLYRSFAMYFHKVTEQAKGK